MTYRFTVSWPPPDLWPNSRVDRRRSTATRNRYKSEGWAAALAAGARNLEAEALHVTLVFHPPDRNRRDIDNLVGASKYLIDGIALATGVDDSLWALTARRGAVVEGGCVAVEIEVTPALVLVPFRGVIR